MHKAVDSLNAATSNSDNSLHNRPTLLCGSYSIQQINFDTMNFTPHSNKA